MTATQEQTAPAPDRTGRRAPRRKDSRVLSAVLGLALAAGAIWLQSIALDNNAMEAPLTYVGDRDDTVDGGRFSVKVTSVATAKSIETDQETVETDQVFLVVVAMGTVPSEPLKLSQPTLLTADGLKFQATDRIPATSTLANRWLQPGFWNDGFFFFEVPPAALPDAKVVFEIPNSPLYGEPLMPEVEIDLGLDQATAKQPPKDVHSLKKSR